MAGNIRPSGDGYLVGTFEVTIDTINRGEVVALTADGKIRQASAASAPLGVALVTGAVGERIEIVRGYCLALAGAGFSAATVTELAADATGRLVAAGDYTGAGNEKHVTATSIADAAAAGDLVPVFVSPYLSTADHT